MEECVSVYFLDDKANQTSSNGYMKKERGSRERTHGGNRHNNGESTPTGWPRSQVHLSSCRDDKSNSGHAMVARTTCNPRVASWSLACVTFVFFFWQRRLVHMPMNKASRGLSVPSKRPHLSVCVCLRVMEKKRRSQIVQRVYQRTRLQPVS